MAHLKRRTTSAKCREMAALWAQSIQFVCKSDVAKGSSSARVVPSLGLIVNPAEYSLPGNHPRFLLVKAGDQFLKMAMEIGHDPPFFLSYPLLPRSILVAGGESMCCPYNTRTSCRGSSCMSCNLAGPKCHPSISIQRLSCLPARAGRQVSRI
jgi:hypothetical protein